MVGRDFFVETVFLTFGFLRSFFLQCFLLWLCCWGEYLPAEIKNIRSENENKPTALEILNERYAKGDISKKEYELMRKDLNFSSPTEIIVLDEIAAFLP